MNKMRVGILSMQRVNNYGSFWQAYCLKKTIEKSGNTVEFIDIIPGETETVNKYKMTFGLKKIVRLPYYVFQYKKAMMFREWQRRELGLTDAHNYNDDYDVIIIGSDEVFNCAQVSPWGCSLQLFGNIHNPNVNTYAASFGNTSQEYIKKIKMEKSISAALSNIKNISVRDDNSKRIIEWLIGYTPEVHVDPVIIGDLPFTLPKIKEKNYILIYSYDYRFCNSELIDQIRQLAHREKLKIYSVGFFQKWVDRNILPNPLQLLSYFKNANYIVTDTFHGTIFSMRFYKHFATVVISENNMKLQDLINRLEIDDHQYSTGKDLLSILQKDFPAREFEEKRRVWRDSSICFLNNCMTQ